MNSATSQTAAENVSVGMAQIALVESPVRANSILGSCVALTLFNARLKVGAMSHIVLPESPEGHAGAPGKFADTAVPKMLEYLRGKGVMTSGTGCKGLWRLRDV